jgi:hypothetical protein
MKKVIKVTDAGIEQDFCLKPKGRKRMYALNKFEGFQAILPNELSILV